MNNELVPITKIPEQTEKEEFSRINAFGLMKKETEDISQPSAPDIDPRQSTIQKIKLEKELAR